MDRSTPAPRLPRKIDFKPILSQEERNIIASLKREEINGIAKLLLAAELIQLRQSYA